MLEPTIKDCILRLRSMFDDMGPTGEGRFRGHYEADLAAFEKIAGVLEAAEWKKINVSKVVPAGSIVARIARRAILIDRRIVNNERGGYWLTDGYTHYRIPYEPQLPEAPSHG